MKTNFLVALLAVASTFAACKKDNNNGPQPEDTKLPSGQYRLIESVQYDQSGKDSASVKFPVSNLSLTFDQDKKTAAVTGKPEGVQVTGTYNVNPANALTDAVIKTTKIAASPNDLLVVGLLEKGETFEAKGGTVTLMAKDKGRLVFSMQK
ncbi:hypothetical protein TH53_07355 [Pedobacter lusitanus]|uniref:Contig29, whole genome shotgun sequence n=1 Tax=Pedobacter lusitanus TaxID=1503925 RepID=A0A0D0GTE7_9SPHI|nr:hypothetical protein [Pedobacter lusitanus]KIO77741.1 hypothetical protein TH53_07355 [Pedobacter lusitanus]